jgi:hypothetical protein
MWEAEETEEMNILSAFMRIKWKGRMQMRVATEDGW